MTVGCTRMKQWKKEQASRCCIADVCRRQSVNQLLSWLTRIFCFLFASGSDSGDDLDERPKHSEGISCRPKKECEGLESEERQRQFKCVFQFWLELCRFRLLRKCDSDSSAVFSNICRIWTGVGIKRNRKRNACFRFTISYFNNSITSDFSNLFRSNFGPT